MFTPAVSSKNVMLASDGRIVLLDFGVATVDAWPIPVQEGKLRGTYASMSPEQTWGERLDARSDIFALGSLMHEMLGGVAPFERETPVNTLYAIRDEAPPPLPNAPQALLNVMSWCLEKPLHRRCASMENVAKSLSHVMPNAAAAAHALQRFLSNVCWSQEPNEAPTQEMPRKRFQTLADRGPSHRPAQLSETLA
jgi:eukaryotic-like serine/threonine-protein kinase